jgi:hypothetical protein
VHRKELTDRDLFKKSAKRYAHVIDFRDIFRKVKELWLVENSQESDFRNDLQTSMAYMQDEAA